MKFRTINNINKCYLASFEETNEWFFIIYEKGKDGWCHFNLWDVQNAKLGNTKIPRMGLKFIHFPSGDVFEPVKPRDDLFVSVPVFSGGEISYLTVDFLDKKIRIHTFSTSTKEIVIIKDFELDTMVDYQNLQLTGEPLTLFTFDDVDSFEILYPERLSIKLNQSPSLICRIGDNLYFYEWKENPKTPKDVVEPENFEYVTEVNIVTGKRHRIQGTLTLMPDGSYWLSQ